MDSERILYIQDYLARSTSPGKTVTVKDIQNYLLNNHDISASPLTIRRDIDRLIVAGNEVNITYKAHNTAHYYMQNKAFSFNEIRFIVDSISINMFLSNKQKQTLVKKFEGLCSEDEVRHLISRISLNGRGAPSLDLLKNLETVHRIISEKRKINFEYGKFDVHRQMKYYEKRRELVPCKVVFFNERFYLKCVNKDDMSIRTYRIDRMKNIVGGEKSTKNIAMPKYDGAVVDIFESERFEQVRLRVKRVLLDDMHEQLGNYANFRNDPEHPDSVIINAKIGISLGFYHWAMRYGDDIEILAPADVRMTFAERVKNLYRLYEK